VVAAADDGGGAHAGEQVQVPLGLKLTDSHSKARGQQQHGLRRTKTNREGEMEQSSGRLYPEDEEARTGAVLYVPQGGMTKWAAAFACLPISTSTQEMGGQGRRGRRRVGMRRSQPARAASLPAVLFGRCSKPAVCRCDRRRRKGKSFSRDHCCNTTPKLPSPYRSPSYLV
jgi:hypothetical protein